MSLQINDGKNGRHFGRRRAAWALGLGFTLLFALLSTAPRLLAQGEEPRGGEPRAGEQTAQVSAYLQAQLRTTPGAVSFLVVLREQVAPETALTRANLRNASRHAKATFLYRELTTTARRTQAALRAWLDEQKIPYHTFYLVNMIEVEGNAQLVEALRQRPEVDRLIPNPRIDQGLHTLPQPPQFTVIGADEAQATLALPYGLEFTHAPEVWAMGYRGQGIVLASQDTGVEWEHPALKAAYRGVITDTNTTTITHIYNWYDAWGTEGRPARCTNDPQVPCDDEGHGTHTVGTMLGDATVVSDTVLGMAPDAKWIGCRNMNKGVGTPASYTACFEFFLAPYPQGGNPATDGHPELGPHIINNSWGCPPSEGCDAASLQQVVETVRAAGQFVVASAGNKGNNLPIPMEFNGCNTVEDPIAIYDAVFSVGAHGTTGTIASFSSRGTVTVDDSGRMKPDISAPGVAVRSTWVNGGFNTIQGTSMASPHVAGAAALLWSAIPELIGNIDMTEQVLIKSATPVLFNQCGESATPVAPNNTYGYGLLNILAAVQLAQQPASLTLTITDENNNTVTDAPVTLIDSLTGYRYPTTTVANGTATFPRLYAGNYRVTVGGAIPIEQVLTLAGNETKQVALQQTQPAPTIFLPFIAQN